MAPIRIGIPAFFAAFTTISTLSGPPMFPGLMRTAATPPSIAFSASEALKWMSAITGIGERRTILGSASASSDFGTATRTISQPAEASAAICAVVASTSWVFVSVIDWTTTGAPPPIRTPPTEICLVLATSRRSLSAPGSVTFARGYPPPRRPTSLEIPITNRKSTSAIPTTETRSYTSRATALPRIPSMIEKAM